MNKDVLEVLLDSLVRYGKELFILRSDNCHTEANDLDYKIDNIKKEILAAWRE